MDASYGEDNRKRFGEEGISVSNKLVAATESEIRRNNRLSLLMEIHEKRRRQGANEVKKQEHEVDKMAKTFKGTCEVCGQKGALVRLNHSLNMCSTCQSVYAHVHNRLPIVAAAVRQSEKLSELLMELGVEQVAVHAESSALKRVGELVGYGEGTADGLIEAIAAALKEKKSCDGCTFEADDKFTEICSLLDIDRNGDDFTYESVVEAVIQICENLSVVRRLLNLEDTASSDAIATEMKTTLQTNSWLNARVKEFGDRAESRSEILAEIMAEISANSAYLDRPESYENLPQIVANIACDHNRLRRDILRLKGERDVLVDQVTDSEQRALEAEQIFARLREMLQADALPNAEIPNAVSMLVTGSNGTGISSIELAPASVEVIGEPSWAQQRGALDSHLLDLLVDFPSIGIERIAVIREAV